MAHIATGPTFRSNQLQLLGCRPAGADDGGDTSDPRSRSSDVGDVHGLRARVCVERRHNGGLLMDEACWRGGRQACIGNQVQLQASGRSRPSERPGASTAVSIKC
jgi:hypothetical protein